LTDGIFEIGEHLEPRSMEFPQVFVADGVAAPILGAVGQEGAIGTDRRGDARAACA